MEPYKFNDPRAYAPGAPVSWSPPPPGRYKMNTDGGARSNPGPSGYGGILRDHYGNWVIGFLGFIGHHDVLTAEFHGIFKGLVLLDKFGLTKSILESDCEAAVEWINSNTIPYLHCDVIHKCRHLADKNEIDVISVPRKLNECADMLANMGIESKEGYMEIDELPHELKHKVEAEASIFKDGSASISGRPLYLS